MSKLHISLMGTHLNPSKYMYYKKAQIFSYKSSLKYPMKWWNPLIPLYTETNSASQKPQNRFQKLKGKNSMLRFNPRSNTLLASEIRVVIHSEWWQESSILGVIRGSNISSATFTYLKIWQTQLKELNELTLVYNILTSCTVLTPSMKIG